MRATRLLETATYLALGISVALWVTLSVLFLPDRSEVCDTHTMMAVTANSGTQLATGAPLNSPSNGSDGLTADDCPSGETLSVGCITSAGVVRNGTGAAHPYEQSQGLRQVSFSLTERARLDPASLPPARASSGDLGDALLVLGQAPYLVRESIPSEAFEGVPGESAGPVSFRRLRESQGLAGAAAVLSGLLLLALIRRSFAAQKAETREVVQAMATLELSAKENTAELQRTLTSLRLYATHVDATLEAERIRVAHDLHDELGSLLTALKLELSGVSGCAPQAGREPPVRRASADLVDSAMQSVRSLIATVQPYPLHLAGLWGALVWKAGEFEKSLNIPYHVEMREDLPWPSKRISLAAFRIVEEALTNVARHARATTVDIRVQFVAGQLLIEVIDDGCGMPSAGEFVGIASHGLTGMRERARAVDGTVTLIARTGHGTIVRFTVQDQGSQMRPAFYEEVS